MNAWIRVVALLVVVVPCGVQAEIYRWVDDSGRVHFTDRPQEGHPMQAVERLRDDAPSATASQADAFSPPPPETLLTYHHPAPSDVLRIRRLFEAEQFEQLNQLLADSVRLISEDIDAEMQHADAYFAFRSEDPTWGERFDRWIAQYPGQHQGYLARASYLSYRGWQARGGDYIRNTPRENLVQMKAFMHRAQGDVARALAIDGGALWAYCLRISMAMALGDSEEGSRALKQATQRYPATYLVRSYYLNMLDPKWGGSKAASRGFANHAQRYVGSNPRLRQLLSQIDHETGRMAYANKNYPDAVDYLSAAIEQGTTPQAYFTRGRAHARLGNHEKALLDFNEAIKHGREDADYYHWRARSLIALNRSREALIDSQRAYALNPENEAISLLRHRLMGSVTTPPIAAAEKRSGGSSEAESLFREAMELLENNQPGLARDRLDRAIALQPDEFRFYQLIDHALFKQGKLREILGYWETYLAIRPDDGRAYLERGGTYYHLQDYDAAMADAKRAIALGNEGAKGLQQRLESTGRP